MNSRITKFATAAVIVAAVLAGFNMMSRTGSVALADVLENIMDITSFSYWMRTSGADTSDYTEFQILSSKDYGQRSDAYVPDEAGGQLKLFTSTYTVLSEQIMISVLPVNKQYTRINLTEKLLTDMEKDSGNPGFFLREFIKHPYTELGRDTIDGIDVIGFESTDIASSDDDAAGSIARLWIDVRTELPVKIEAETFAQDGSLVSQMTTYRFDWNIQVDESDFEPVIPDDYVDLDFGEVEFSADETSVINGLRFYAEIFKGKYPESLAVKTLTLSKQVEAAIRSGSSNFIAGKTQDQLLQELGQGCMNLEFTAIFYGILASENKAVAYYGDKVTAENPDAVLMRWRQDGGRYKVIFGDLTIKKVTEAALQQLENMPIIKDSK